MTSRRKKLFLGSAVFVGCYVVVAVAVQVTASSPPRELWPKTGTRLTSRVERVEQMVIREEEGDVLYTELVLLPGAAGPPMHYHRDFEEAFVVEEGTLEVETAEGVRTVHQGESHSFPPGMRHRPFNSSNDRVVLRGRIPARFAACLSQLYPALDNGSNVVLQLSLMHGYCDTHVAPGAAEAIVFALAGPIARLAGYQSWYER